MNSITTFHKTGDVKKNAAFDRRNEQLLKFLLANGLNNIRLIGNAQSPVIIYNSETRLSCYVDDYNLILRESYKNDNVIGTLVLNRKKITDAESLLLDFLYNSEHSDVFRIGLNPVPGLFLSGYNYVNRESKLGKEPVFSKLDARIYLSATVAQVILDEFPDYPLEII